MVKKYNVGAIHRHNSGDAFTVIDNSLIQNTDLTFGARGLIIYLLSLPPNFRVYKSKLDKYTMNGRTAVATMWDELSNRGFIKTTVLKHKGLIKGYQYDISSTPDYEPNFRIYVEVELDELDFDDSETRNSDESDSENQQSDFSDSENRISENRKTDGRLSENLHLQNNIYIKQIETKQTFDDHSGKKSSKSRAPKKTGQPQVGNGPDFQTHFWAVYLRKVGKAKAKHIWDTKMTVNDREIVCRALPGYNESILSKRELDKIPHASTFLNSKIWEDDEFLFFDPNGPKNVNMHIPTASPGNDLDNFDPAKSIIDKMPTTKTTKDLLIAKIRQRWDSFLDKSMKMGRMKTTEFVNPNSPSGDNYAMNELVSLIKNRIGRYDIHVNFNNIDKNNPGFKPVEVYHGFLQKSLPLVNNISENMRILGINPWGVGSVHSTFEHANGGIITT